MEKPETSGSPLNDWSLHSIQRVKPCVTQTADEVQQNMEKQAGNYAHFHATAMSVYQRKPTIDDRAFLTEAEHLDSYLPPTIITDGMAVVQ